MSVCARGGITQISGSCILYEHVTVLHNLVRIYEELEANLCEVLDFTITETLLLGVLLVESSYYCFHI